MALGPVSSPFALSHVMPATSVDNLSDNFPISNRYVRSMYPSANTDPAVLLFYVFQLLHLLFFCTPARLTTLPLGKQCDALLGLYFRRVISFLAAIVALTAQSSQSTKRSNSKSRSLPSLLSSIRGGGRTTWPGPCRLATENLPRNSRERWSSLRGMLL